MNNRSPCIRIVIDGKEMTPKEVAQLAGVGECTIRGRLRDGWVGERLLTGVTPKTASKNTGMSNGQVKLNAVDIERIRDMCINGVEQKQIAAFFGVCRDYVSRIKRGVAR